MGCGTGALQPCPRPTPALNEGPHACQRCGRDSGQACDKLLVFSIEGSFASHGGDGTGVPEFVVGESLASARGPLRAGVDGPKGCD